MKPLSTILPSKSFNLSGPKKLPICNLPSWQLFLWPQWHVQIVATPTAEWTTAVEQQGWNVDAKNYVGMHADVISFAPTSMAFPAPTSMELINVQRHYIHISYTTFHSNWTTYVKSTYIKFICTCKWSVEFNALIFKKPQLLFFFLDMHSVLFSKQIKMQVTQKKFLLMPTSKLCFSLHWISLNSSQRNNFFKCFLMSITYFLQSLQKWWIMVSL